nr:hypothetical protein [Palleronia marisminoris]
MSTPTIASVAAAEEADMTLVALARGRAYEVFTHPPAPHRIAWGLSVAQRVKRPGQVDRAVIQRSS